MSNSPKVRVTKAGMGTFWYRNEVGNEFEVEEWDENEWVLSEDLKDDSKEFRLIDKSDSEVIE